LGGEGHGQVLESEGADDEVVGEIVALDDGAGGTVLDLEAILQEDGSGGRSLYVDWEELVEIEQKRERK
jgi:hypothetical protein